MVDTDADVLCDVQEEELDPQKTVNNCQLYLKHEIDSYGMAFITVAYDPESDLAINVTKDVSEEMTIETDDLTLTYVADYAADGVYFNLVDKLTGESKTLGFDIRYWQS